MFVDTTKTTGRTFRRVAQAGLRVAGLGGLLFGGVSAVGAAAPAGGAIRVFVTPSNGGGVDPIVFTGAIGDFGKSVNIDKNGKTNPNGNYAKVTLKKGTFDVDLTKLQAASNNVQPTTNPMTCSASASVTEPVTLYGGTGLYKGIAGLVKITETFGFIGPVYASGAKKGQCNMSNSAQPLAQYVSITGTGTVKFS
jgi:hypothetical protein